jgi:hypothetical protein
LNPTWVIFLASINYSDSEDVTLEKCELPLQKSQTSHESLIYEQSASYLNHNNLPELINLSKEKKVLLPKCQVYVMSIYNMEEGIF